MKSLDSCSRISWSLSRRAPFLFRALLSVAVKQSAAVRMEASSVFCLLPSAASEKDDAAVWGVGAGREKRGGVGKEGVAPGDFQMTSLIVLWQGAEKCNASLYPAAIKPHYSPSSPSCCVKTPVFRVSFEEGTSTFIPEQQLLSKLLFKGRPGEMHTPGIPGRLQPAEASKRGSNWSEI